MPFYSVLLKCKDEYLAATNRQLFLVNALYTILMEYFTGPFT